GIHYVRTPAVPLSPEREMPAWTPPHATHPICVGAGVLAACLGASAARGQGPVPRHAPAPAAPVAAAAGAHELTAADLEPFLDGLVPLQLGHGNIAGAVVAVVKDGKVVLAKGYGYSDMDRKTPVSADSTLFRPGSIS